LSRKKILFNQVLNALTYQQYNSKTIRLGVVKMTVKTNKGGLRQGAGRKSKGITKKVSLTLSEPLWREINDFDGTCADYIRSLKQQIEELNTNAYANNLDETYLNKVTSINEDEHQTKHQALNKVTSINEDTSHHSNDSLSKVNLVNELVTLINEINEHDIPNELTHECIQYYFQVYSGDYLNELQDKSEFTHRAIDDTHRSLFNSFFNKQRFSGIEIGLRYRSPFTNKWFSSINNMLKAELPRLISGREQKYQRQKEDAQRKAHAEYLMSLNKVT